MHRMDVLAVGIHVLVIDGIIIHFLEVFTVLWDANDVLAKEQCIVDHDETPTASRLIVPILNSYCC